MRIQILLSTLLLAPGLAWAQVPVTAASDQLSLLRSPDPALARNKRLVYDYFREVLEAGHPEWVVKYLTSDFVQHDPNMASGREEFEKIVKARSPVPRPLQATLRTPLVSIVAEGDLVVLVILKSNPVPGEPGKEYTTTSCEIYRISKGKIAEHWGTTRKE